MGINLPIFKMFAQSPIRPLQEHIHKAHSCAKLLLPFFEAVLQQDWTEAEAVQVKIAQLEVDADNLKKELRLNLPKSLFLPIARTDVLELISMQDRIANKAEDIAGIVLGRKMTIPDVLAADLQQFLARSIDASQQACKAIDELDELLESGFRGNEVKLVEEMIHELDKIEHDTDEMQIKIRKSLFSIEQELPPIEVIFLYKIIDWIGDLADRAQTVGGRLQLIVAK